MLASSDISAAAFAHPIQPICSGPGIPLRLNRLTSARAFPFSLCSFVLRKPKIIPAAMTTASDATVMAAVFLHREKNASMRPYHFIPVFALMLPFDPKTASSCFRVEWSSFRTYANGSCCIYGIVGSYIRQVPSMSTSGQACALFPVITPSPYSFKETR